jgi:hypothetical protein
MRQIQHKIDICIKREKVDKFLFDNDWKLPEFLNRIQIKYGIDLKYKGLSSLLENKCSWKLLYAYAISDFMKLSIYELFEITNAKTKEKEEGYV